VVVLVQPARSVEKEPAMTETLGVFEARKLTDPVPMYNKKSLLDIALVTGAGLVLAPLVSREWGTRVKVWFE